MTICNLDFKFDTDDKIKKNGEMHFFMKSLKSKLAYAM